MTTDTSSSLAASKPRFEILDGLRGVAAMLVVAYHLLETHFHDPCLHPLNHGYLAVDFFMLSGFVGGDQCAQRAAVVADVGVPGQHPLRKHHPPFQQNRADSLRVTLGHSTRPHLSGHRRLRSV